MKILRMLSFRLIVTVLWVGAAHGQVPASNDTSDGSKNTGMGAGALGGPQASNGGVQNTASGFDALYSNTTGGGNTASGVNALYSNTTGAGNTASGSNALAGNTTGLFNVAFGSAALIGNVAGSNNTAVGVSALFSNDFRGSGDASYNTAVGTLALFDNATGANNTAVGVYALYMNNSGKGNSAFGVNAIHNNFVGIRNVGLGNNTLYSTNGSYNIALGFDAGYNVTSGSNNIEIGAMGTANDDSTIQIGVQGTQTFTTIAGIYGTPITGSAVYVTSSGQLGVLPSSERYKTDIAPIGSDTNKLRRLRPVRFHLKTDPHGAVQYGLIAEEVDQVYPELVIRDSGGKIQGVHYEELAPMLLNEMQKQQRINDAQADEIRDLKHELAELSGLKKELHAALRHLQENKELVANR